MSSLFSMSSFCKKLLLFFLVALIGLAPAELNAQNGSSSRHRAPSSRAHRSKRQQASTHRRPSTSRKRSSSSQRSQAPSIVINDYWMETDYVDDDGELGVAFLIDFNVKNRKNKVTFVCIYFYQRNNYIPIRDQFGDPLVTYVGFRPDSNNETGLQALLTISYEDLLAADWDPDEDGISFDLVVEDENEDMIYLEENIDPK